jgi:hypothetical protein
MTPAESNAIRNAVTSTFCKGNRRPSARSDVRVADKSRGPSVQARSEGEFNPRQRNTKLTAHETRKRMKAGLCHRSIAGDGLEMGNGATSADDESCAAPLPNTLTRRKLAKDGKTGKVEVLPFIGSSSVELSWPRVLVEFASGFD